MLCSKIVFKTELPLNLLFWSDGESYFKGKVTSLPRSLFCAIIVPQQTFLASRIRISNKTLFWFSVGIHCSMVDSQVLFLSHGVWLVFSFLVVWLVLHYRVCSILDKILNLFYNPSFIWILAFSIRRVLLKKHQMKKAQKMTNKKYVIKSFYQLL